MKVAHRDDYDTHAIVGGRDIEAFGVAQTAEFFTVLSNTLYTNKPLAVVREYLCNAWDAHIASGRTHLPVEVTLDAEKMSIKDKGLGIPHDKIHPIFCIYGNSTKENDGKQTGGFGLGSKSGFAYSDHFTVVNCHAGTKVVHAISRGSARTQGKPDRREMVRVPSPEEGLEVIIPIKTSHDMDTFEKYIREVVQYGDMNVKLNGKSIPTIKIHKAEDNLFLTDRQMNFNSRILVRYGNVIYPIDSYEDYAVLYRQIDEWIKALPQQYNKMSLILQAPPHSISVTPAREALSMTETTIETIKGLLKHLWNKVKPGSSQLMLSMRKHYNDAFDIAYNRMEPHRIFEEPNIVALYKPYMTTYSQTHMQITSMDQLALYLIDRRHGSYKNHQTTFMELRAQALIDGGSPRSMELKKFIKQLRMKDHNRQTYKFVAFRKTFFRPLLKKLAQHPVLSHKNMHVHLRHKYGMRTSYAEFMRYIPEEEEKLALLQGLVIVTHSKQNLDEYWNHNLFSFSHPRLVYVAPRTKDHRVEAIKFFQGLGYHVIDFEEILKQIDLPVKVRSAIKVEKPKGLPTISNLLSDERLHFNMRGHLRKEDEDFQLRRVENPTYVIQPKSLSGSDYDRKFFPWGDDEARWVVRYLTDDTMGIVVNQPQYEAMIKNGAKDGVMHIMDNLKKLMLGSPRIQSHITLNQPGVSSTAVDKLKILMKMQEHSALLKRELDLPEPATTDEIRIITVYESILKRSYHRDAKPWEIAIKDIEKQVTKWKISPITEKVLLSLRRNPLIECVDLGDCLEALKNLDPVNPDYKIKTYIEMMILGALRYKK